MAGNRDAFFLHFIDSVNGYPRCCHIIRAEAMSSLLLENLPFSHQTADCLFHEHNDWRSIVWLIVELPLRWKASSLQKKDRKQHRDLEWSFHPAIYEYYSLMVFDGKYLLSGIITPGWLKTFLLFSLIIILFPWHTEQSFLFLFTSLRKMITTEKSYKYPSPLHFQQ